MSDSIEISLSVRREEVEGLTSNQRSQLLGEMAAQQVDTAVPLPADRTPWKGRYTEANIRKAFRKWAKLHDGLAPRRVDWAAERDPGPDHIWPRAERVARLGTEISEQYGVRTTWASPHRDSREQQDLWYRQENGFCAECFQGSGCLEPEMSGWQFAVEILGGLQIRTSADLHPTKSQRGRHGRNRQMVTGGVADVHLHRSDPAAGACIETLDAGR